MRVVVASSRRALFPTAAPTASSAARGAETTASGPSMSRLAQVPRRPYRCRYRRHHRYRRSLHRRLRGKRLPARPDAPAAPRSVEWQPRGGRRGIVTRTRAASLTLLGGVATDAATDGGCTDRLNGCHDRTAVDGLCPWHPYRCCRAPTGMCRGRSCNRYQPTRGGCTGDARGNAKRAALHAAAAAVPSVLALVRRRAPTQPPRRVRSSAHTPPLPAATRSPPTARGWQTASVW